VNSPTYAVSILIIAKARQLTQQPDTPIPVDPDDFTLKNGYDLRARRQQRHTEMMIGVTCYNEDKTLLCRTLHSVIRDCRVICTLKKSSFWNKGGPAWQKLVVCLLVDGLDACDPGFLDVLATIGLFQQRLLRSQMEDGREVLGHVVGQLLLMTRTLG